MANNLTSPISLARMATIIFGIITLGLGLYAHFQSDWTSYDDPDEDESIKPHELVCENLEDVDVSCPSIALEYFYVSVIIVCFVISVILAAASVFVDMGSGPVKLLDMGYHIVAGLILLAAAITYIISAEQINNLIKDEFIVEVEDVKFRRVEKIVAAALTILNAVLYGVVAVTIGKIG